MALAAAARSGAAAGVAPRFSTPASSDLKVAAPAASAPAGIARPVVGAVADGSSAARSSAAGNALSSIARANGTTPEHMVELNQGRHPGLATNPDLILVGWHLVVPR